MNIRWIAAWVLGCAFMVGAQDGLPIDETPTGAPIAAAMAYNGSHAGMDLTAMPANILISGTWRVGYPVGLKLRWPAYTVGDLALGFQSTLVETYELHDGRSYTDGQGNTVYNEGYSGMHMGTGFGVYGLWRWNQRWSSTLAGSYLLATPGYVQRRVEIGTGGVFWKRLRVELGPTYTWASTDPGITGVSGPGLQAQIGVDLDNQTVHQKSGLAMLTFANVGLLLLFFVLFGNAKVG